MQRTRQSEKQEGRTRARSVSLDVTDHDALDLKMLEAIERIERVRSKAMLAVGSMLAAHQ